MESLFTTIARATDHRVQANFNYEGLAAKLAGAEEEQSSPVDTVDHRVAVRARTSGPELRNLSDDRQRLETQLYGVILRWNTLRSRGLMGDPILTVRATEVVNDFWGSPTSLVTDGDVLDALQQVEAAIADLDGRPVQGHTLETLLLRALYEQEHERSQTSAITSFDVDGFARSTGLSTEEVQRSIQDLLMTGLAEPYLETQGVGALRGELRITGDGVRELQGKGATR